MQPPDLLQSIQLERTLLASSSILLQSYRARVHRGAGLRFLSGPATEHAARIRSDGHAIFARCYTARAQLLIFFQVSELLCYKTCGYLARC